MLAIQATIVHKQMREQTTIYCEWEKRVKGRNIPTFIRSLYKFNFRSNNNSNYINDYTVNPV